MRYAITGPVDITAEQAAFVRALVQAIPQELRTEFTSGCAYGVDTEAALAAGAAGFGLIRLTIPTGAWYNKELEQTGIDAGWEILRTKEYPHPPDAYMPRNDKTVSHCDVLIATPPTSEESGRGGPAAGTWATIRRGRKSGCEVRIYPLDGSEPWVEPATRLLLV